MRQWLDWPRKQRRRACDLAPSAALSTIERGAAAVRSDGAGSRVACLAQGRRECIVRRSFLPSAPKKDGPRFNDMIDVPRVRLISASGDMLGVVEIAKAMSLAVEAGLDLVEVSPNADPPVCKVLDYGKFKYEAQKKANAARKKQKVIEVKEIKMRPSIESHDYGVKMRSINRFLEEGDKVKVTLRFRGRELVHQELGMKVLERVRGDVEEVAKIEQFPRMEGRMMTMIIAPK
ncbi:MAG: translation initiation factor IF-3 [Alphaproteobacteria bacterium]|nr:translation initiation factor IF-3 [Alphaproteobacteria bacterium]